MKAKIFICLLLLIAHSAYTQTLTLKGSMWDNHTNRYLPVTVYAITDTKKTLLGSSVQLDVFEHQYEVQLPLNTDSLRFESPGHSPICLPVYFHGTFQKHSEKVLLSIEMPEAGEDVSQRTYTHLAQPQKGTVADNEFKLHFFSEGRYGYTGNISRILDRSGFSHIPSLYKSFGLFKVTITSPQGELITQHEFSPVKGINIVDVNIYPQKKTAILQTTNEITSVTETEKRVLPVQVQNATVIHEYPYGIPPIFFDQSKYELKTRGRHTLDSLLDYLNHKTDSKISVKGFTDQVGDPTLNATLARYRALVVARYLTGKGLSPDRVNIQWDERGTQTLTDSGLSRYRKVLIHELD